MYGAPGILGWALSSSCCFDSSRFFGRLMAVSRVASIHIVVVPGFLVFAALQETLPEDQENRELQV